MKSQHRGRHAKTQLRRPIGWTLPGHTEYTGRSYRCRLVRGMVALVPTSAEFSKYQKRHPVIAYANNSPRRRLRARTRSQSISGLSIPKTSLAAVRSTGQVRARAQVRDYRYGELSTQDVYVQAERNVALPPPAKQVPLLPSAPGQCCRKSSLG